MQDETFHDDLARMLMEASGASLVRRLAEDLGWLTTLVPVYERNDPGQPALPPLGALGILLGARALMRTGRGAQAWPFIETALDAYAAAHPRGPRRHVRHSAFGDALGAYPELRLIVVEALVAVEQWADAAGALSDLTEDVERGRERPAGLARDDLASLTALAQTQGFGPLHVAPGWTLAWQRRLVASGKLNEAKEHTWKVYAQYLVSALRAGATDEAVDFVRSRAAVAGSIAHADHYDFNAVCVLSHAGLIDEAVAAARELVRCGFRQLWRFDRKAAEAMWWTKAMGQLEWLAPLEGVPGFEDLRARYVLARSAATEGPLPAPFRILDDATLGGKARKRCAISRRLVAPGAPIKRFRLFFDVADDPSIAAKDAFETSALAVWRDRHLSDGYAPGDFLAPPAFSHAQRFEAPAAAAFLFDLGEGRPFDADAFIATIARPTVFPMRFEWVRGPFDYWTAFEDGPCVNDDHAGDYVGLTWMMLRCGFGSAIFRRLGEIEPAIADPIFAMLATFAREDCRRAAAAHFGLDALPATMDRAFQSRLSLDDILELAAFGRDEPRFADALARALADYNLHIYSNSHPQVDWFLQDLEHYAYAKGGHLAFFFVHAPEKLPVLDTMLARRWLVSGVGLGGYDGYRNLCHLLFHAAVVNRMLHALEELPFWLETPWVEHYIRGPTLREARRHAALHARRQTPRRAAVRAR